MLHAAALPPFIEIVSWKKVLPVNKLYDIIPNEHAKLATWSWIFFRYTLHQNYLKQTI